METVEQQTPVGQFGQRIVERQVADFLFSLFARGNVAENGDILSCSPLLIFYGGDGQPLRINLSALAPVPNFAGPRTGTQQLLPQFRIEGLILTSGTEDARILAQHLF